MTRIDLPRFITIEGGEGAGKTTLILRFKEILQSLGIPVVTTREPGGSLLSNQIRDWLLSRQPTVKIGAKAELLMFLAARAQHIEELIAPALAAGKVVLCDRFNDSTIAYQGAGRGLGVSFVRELCQAVCGRTVPDLTFYLDVDPVVGLQRTRHSSKENAAAGEVDRMEAEKLEFHQRVRDVFVEMAQAEPARFAIVDASRPQKAVVEACEKILLTHFGRDLLHN